MTVRLRVPKDIRRLAYWIATAILWRDSRPRSMYSRQRMAPPVFVDEYMYVRWLKTALSVTGTVIPVSLLKRGLLYPRLR